MRRFTPATSEDGQAIAIAVERLREARNLLRRAGARRAAWLAPVRLSLHHNIFVGSNLVRQKAGIDQIFVVSFMMKKKVYLKME